ncbi:hypothetical protein KSC_017350 [Ktedonobacter sp. SOSP1-52]|nr:hypothetical protein KSC_017350 [Ktedonobacter sp. SOSP1-52]
MTCSFFLEARGLNGRRGSGGCGGVISPGPESEPTEKDCPTQGKRHNRVHDPLTFTSEQGNRPFSK